MMWGFESPSSHDKESSEREDAAALPYLIVIEKHTVGAGRRARPLTRLSASSKSPHPWWKR